MTETANYPVRTTSKSLDIVEHLMEKGEAGVTELATDLGMSKSIVHNHLSTLEERGYVLNDDGVYQLSFKFLKIGGVKRHRSKLYTISRPEIEELAKQTDEVANVATMERGYCVYLSVSKGDNAVDLEVAFEGQYEYMHSTAIGKAMLASLPTSTVNDIVELRGMKGLTENTITDLDTLHEHLDEISDRGYAIDDGETVPGLRCVAAPIKTKEGDVLGGVSVSGPASRFQGDFWEEELPKQVRNTTNVIELRIQYSDFETSSII